MNRNGERLVAAMLASKFARIPLNEDKAATPMASGNRLLGDATSPLFQDGHGLLFCCA